MQVNVEYRSIVRVISGFDHTPSNNFRIFFETPVPSEGNYIEFSPAESFTIFSFIFESMAQYLEATSNAP